MPSPASNPDDNPKGRAEPSSHAEAATRSSARTTAVADRSRPASSSPDGTTLGAVMHGAPPTSGRSKSRFASGGWTHDPPRCECITEAPRRGEPPIIDVRGEGSPRRHGPARNPPVGARTSLPSRCSSTGGSGPARAGLDDLMVGAAKLLGDDEPRPAAGEDLAGRPWTRTRRRRSTRCGWAASRPGPS
jgi:hypothetical protein